LTLGLILSLVLPGLLFCAITQSRSGVCLSSYEWSSEEGFLPTPATCSRKDPTPLAASLEFYGRSVGGLLTGKSGQSRENATLSLTELLKRRTLRSLSVVGVAALFLLCFGLAGRLARQLLHGRWPRLLHRVPLLLPAGLPLPIAGFAVFACVLRLLRPGSPLDFDRAAVLWAGLALFLSDGVLFTLLRGMGESLRGELKRRYAETLGLWGADAEKAAAEVSARVRASQVRGALLASFGGLIVVESIFGINGLGETLKDLVVDRQGLDPLLLCGVLLLFTGGVALVQLAPFERLVQLWRPH
jgi:ABC-type dipeptide/oligopeptide/nickel transport system permease component